MATYYKPQSPIQSGEDFIYPITTADQIMKSDKSRRLEQAGLIVADNSTKLDGKASSAYTQSVDGVIPNNAGNVPLNVVSGSRYYNDYTAGGTGDVDYITDTFALVPIDTDKNPDLFAALGSAGSYAYVKTSFYSTQTSTSRRYQVAYSYNSIVQRKAWRTYSSSGWQRWNTDAQFSDVPRFNLLDNSDFSQLIAQAGLNGTYGNTVYIADRWISQTASATQHNGYATLSTTTKTGRIVQKLSDVLAGKTITAAAKVSGNTIVYCGIYYNQNSVSKSIAVSVSAPNGVIMKSGTIPVDATNIEFRLYIAYTDGGGSCDVYWAALYEGSYTIDNLPPYVSKGYIAELAECQRYYYRISPSTSSFPYAYGYCFDTTKARFYIQLPQTMIASKPTFLYTAGSYLRIVQNGTANDITDLSLIATVGNHALIQATSKNLTKQQTASLVMAGGVFEFISDL